MSEEKFRAFRVNEEEDGHFSRSIQELEHPPLRKGDIRVKVEWSSVNYKDALSAHGNKGVTRIFPHTPGIDAAGEVVMSECTEIPVDTQVIVTGCDLGMDTDGGFGEYITVPGRWAVLRPKWMTAKESMIFGTAGLTAGMSVKALLSGHRNRNSRYVVTGATGGVGSTAIKILSKLGHHVVAVTGKDSANEYLESIGASEIISTQEFLEDNHKPLLKPKYTGGIDTQGGEALAAMLKSLHYEGIVAACGNVASPKLDMTVYPFILRGVKLLGIDSQHCPREERKDIWHRLANEWKPSEDMLNEGISVITMEDLDDYIKYMLENKGAGRAVLKHEDLL